MSRRPSLGLIAVFVLAATACGANPAPSEEVSTARADATGTARIEIVTQSAFGTSSDPEHRTSGVIDYADDRSELADQETRGRTITIGEVTYTELGPHRGLPSGKRWLRFDAAESEALFEESQYEQSTEDELGVSTSIIRFSGVEPSPDEYLDYLRAVSGELERVGEETVRKVPTTHYRAKVDVQRSMRYDLAAEGWKEASIERYVDTLIDGDMTEFDVWVDADQIARRVVTKYISPLRDETYGDQTIAMVATTEFFDFGVAVDIDAPPEDEVMDWSTWLAAMLADREEPELVEPLP